MNPNDNLPDREANVPVPLNGPAGRLAWVTDWIKFRLLPSLRGPQYPYYHRVYKRVPTVDECKVDDELCIWEANKQYQRDKMVDRFIVDILDQRKGQCIRHWHPDQEFNCHKEFKDYKDAQTNWQIKYGDMGVRSDAKNAFYKQKHRMVYERRHGPLGYGRKPPSQWKKEWDPSCHSANYKDEHTDDFSSPVPTRHPHFQTYDMGNH